MILFQRPALVGVALSLAIAWLMLAPTADANHSQGGQTWDDCGVGNGCIGWKYFSPMPPEISYIRANPLTDGSMAASAFAAAVNYWDYTAGSVAWFSLNSTPQNYPAARLVPYRVGGSGPLGAAAQEITYDQNGSFGSFFLCEYNCWRPSGGTAYPGYDLSEIIFYDTSFGALSLSAQFGIARHEFVHTLGMVDHNNNSTCSNYVGSMGTNPYPCNSFSITCAERRTVNAIHDRSWPC